MTDSLEVLHVDDDPEFGALVAASLERVDDGISVRTVGDPETAVRTVEAEHVDCVLSDYQMPGTNGLELLEEIRTTHPHVPFILYTAQGSEEIAGEAIRAGVTDYVQKDGGTDHYELVATRIRTAVEQYHATQRHRAEREQYERLFEDAPVMYAVTREGEEGFRIEDCNARFLDRLGYDREAVVGRRISSLYTEASRRRMFEGGGYDRVREGEFTQERRTFRTATGAEVETLLRATPRRDEHGEVVGTIVLAFDRTEYLEYERELRARSEAIEAAIDGIAVLDDDGVFQFVNQAHADIYGYDDPGAFVGRTWRMCYGEDEAERIEGEALPALFEAGSWRGEAVGTRRDGTTFPEELSLTRVDGGGIVCVVRDVSERAEYERRIERQNERLEEFASALSHDLRSPLNVALGRLELAQEACDSDHLAAVTESLERMDALAERMLALARSGQVIGETERVDLTTLAAQCWRNVETSGAELDVADPPTVDADSGRLKQLFENLYRNAVEHGSTGRRPEADDGPGDAGDGADVRVRVGALDGDDGFYVADDGRGVPERERDQVFDRGYSTADDGNGFGLAIVEQIAEAHGWTVTLVESESGGARFELRTDGPP